MLANRRYFQEEKRNIEGVEVIFAYAQKIKAYRLMVDKVDIQYLESPIWSELASKYGTDKRYTYAMRNWFKDTDCFNYLIGNYIRQELKGIVEEDKIESILKAFCEYMGMVYMPYEDACMEIISQREYVKYKQLARRETKHTYEYYFIVDNKLYASPYKGVYIKMEINESLLNLITLLSLDVEDKRDIKLDIADILELYVAGYLKHRVG